MHHRTRWATLCRRASDRQRRVRHTFTTVERIARWQRRRGATSRASVCCARLLKEGSRQRSSTQLESPLAAAAPRRCPDWACFTPSVGRRLLSPTFRAPPSLQGPAIEYQPRLKYIAGCRGRFGTQANAGIKLKGTRLEKLLCPSVPLHALVNSKAVPAHLRLSSRKFARVDRSRGMPERNGGCKMATTSI